MAAWSVPITVFAEKEITKGAFILTSESELTDDDYSYSGGVLTIKSDTAITISNANPGTATTDRIVVESGASANITLSGVNIDVSGMDNTAAFQIEDNSTGNVTITLAEGTTNTLKSGSNCAGLHKNGNTDNIGKLTMQGTGTLNANGGKYGAGIGGGFGGSGSNITISGGTVTANGGKYGAGIGGGDSGSGTNITISGGTVTANGGEDGAGIGGGGAGSGLNITISGGTVTANGGEYGAGIGGGFGGSGLNITISGSIVTANGGIYGAGIGGGFGGSGSNITISGGSVKAIAGTNANAIGGGYERAAVTPTDGYGNNVYLLEIDNTNGANIFINNTDYPDTHIFYDSYGTQSVEPKIYAYLPAKTAADPNAVKVGDVTTKYYYDTVDLVWMEFIDNALAITLDTPTAGTAFDTTAELDNTNADISVAWKNGMETAVGNAEYDTVYTAEITLTPKSGYVFGADIAATVNGNSATVTQNADGTITVAYEFAATEHDWGEVTYTWSEDGKSCTATRICKNDSAHTETATGTVTALISKAPSCSEKGETAYTATFAEDWATEQTKTVAADALGHDWNETTYEWSEDGKSCTATRTCKNDSAHTETATGTVTALISKAPSCSEKGETAYTATFAEDWATEQTKTVETDALGHELAYTQAKASEIGVDGNIGYWHCLLCDKYFSDENAENEITLAQTVIPALKAYPPEIKDSNGGKAEILPEAPAEGDEVIVAVTPDEGYEIDKVIVKDKDGNEIPVIENEDGTYSFIQPEGKVTIEVKYKKSEAPFSPPTGYNNTALLAVMLVSAGVAGTAAFTRKKRS